MREAIGALVEFAVAQLLRTLHRRRGLGVRRRLGFDQTLHRLRVRVITTSDVEPDQDPLPLAQRHHRNLPQRRGRISY